MKWVLVFLMTLAAPSFAAGDALQELKQRLRGAEGVVPVTGVLAVEHASQRGDEAPMQAEVSLTAQWQPDGFAIRWSPDTLARALDERRRGLFTAEAPVQSAMEETDAVDVAGYFDGADTLLSALEHAELLAVHDDGRRLDLALHPRLPERYRKYVDRLTVRAELNLDEEGWPTSASYRSEIEGSIFLVIRFQRVEEAQYRFVREGKALRIAHHVSESSGNGAGESGWTRREVRLSFGHPDAMPSP